MPQIPAGCYAHGALRGMIRILAILYIYPLFANQGRIARPKTRLWSTRNLFRALWDAPTSQGPMILETCWAHKSLWGDSIGMMGWLFYFGGVSISGSAKKLWIHFLNGQWLARKYIAFREHPLWKKMCEIDGCFGYSAEIIVTQLLRNHDFNADKTLSRG